MIHWQLRGFAENSHPRPQAKLMQPFIDPRLDLSFPQDFLDLIGNAFERWRRR
jgi:hypothetical protein